MEQPGFEILRRLGGGEPVSLFLARDRATDQTVVLKSLFPAGPADPELLSLLRREVTIASELEHPNIGRVLELRMEGGRPVLVLEYFEGVRLCSGLPDPSDWLLVMLGVARALAYAHSRGVRHGGLAPENVFFDAGRRRVLVTGFGVCSVLARVSVHRGRFLAPELEADGPADERADMFALGALAHHLLQREEPSPPRELLPLLRACMASDPEARPLAAEVAHALEVSARDEVRALLYEGIRAERAGQLGRASTLHERALRIAPSQSDAHRELTMIVQSLRDRAAQPGVRGPHGGLHGDPAAEDSLVRRSWSEAEAAWARHDFLAAARGLETVVRFRPYFVHGQRPAWKFLEEIRIRACDKVGASARPSAPASTSAPSPSPGTATTAVHENVQFTVYRPRTIQPAKWYPVLAFCHLSERRPGAAADEPDPIDEMRRQAEAVLPGEAYALLTQDSLAAVPDQGEITFLPEVEGLTFNPPRRTFQFQESVHREEFRMQADAAAEGRTLRGRLAVLLGTVIVADVPLMVKVQSETVGPDALAPSSARPYKKIFASYSHKDREIVEQVQAVVGTLGDRFLRDWQDLRAGEDWDDRLLALIREADVFQLFWSWNSMTSPFVRREWEYALSLGRTNFVRPTYWEVPMPALPQEDLPPADLQRLHFSHLAGVAGGTADEPRRGSLPASAWVVMAAVLAAILAWVAWG